jgi:hypothetical protein
MKHTICISKGVCACFYSTYGFTQWINTVWQTLHLHVSKAQKIRLKTLGHGKAVWYFSLSVSMYGWDYRSSTPSRAEVSLVATAPRRTLKPIHLPTQWGGGYLSLATAQPEREADNSPPFSPVPTSLHDMINWQSEYKYSLDGKQPWRFVRFPIFPACTRKLKQKEQNFILYYVIFQNWSLNFHVYWVVLLCVFSLCLII